MAGNMKDIQGRIKSVTSTKQITHAMQLVASAKMRKARERADRRRNYTNYVIDTMHLLAPALGTEEVSPFLRKNDSDRKLYIVITSDKGLAGGFNSNLLKYALASIKDKEKAMMLILGNKGVDFFRRRGFEILDTFTGGSDDAPFNVAEEVAVEATDAFLSGKVGKVDIIYNRFVSVISQKPEKIHVLPLRKEDFVDFEDTVDTAVTTGEQKNESTDIKQMDAKVMLFEPNAAEFVNNLIPQYIKNAVYGAMLESAAGELASRRMAMENATDNADEIIADLSLKYNRARQGAITQEITEIVSGANAIGGGD